MSLRNRISLAAAVSVLVLVPVAANAQVVTVTDAARDVVSGAPEDETYTTPEPQRLEGDVLSQRVDHRARVVRVTLRHSQLTRAAKKDSIVHAVALRTNEGQRAEVFLLVQGKRYQGERMFTVNGKDRRCKGLSTRIDYARDTVQFTVPRRCLSNPRWVEVGAGTAYSKEVEGGRTYADDANLDGRVADDLAFGPRVRRG